MEKIQILAAEFDRRAERIAELEDMLVEVLRKAQRPGSVLAQQKRYEPDVKEAIPTGVWHWLWGTTGGGIGHEDVDARLLPYLAETGEATV